MSQCAGGDDDRRSAERLAVTSYSVGSGLTVAGLVMRVLSSASERQQTTFGGASANTATMSTSQTRDGPGSLALPAAGNGDRTATGHV